MRGCEGRPRDDDEEKDLPGAARATAARRALGADLAPPTTPPWLRPKPPRPRASPSTPRQPRRASPPRARVCARAARSSAASSPPAAHAACRAVSGQHALKMQRKAGLVWEAGAVWGADRHRGGEGVGAGARFEVVEEGRRAVLGGELQPTSRAPRHGEGRWSRDGVEWRTRERGEGRGSREGLEGRTRLHP